MTTTDTPITGTTTGPTTGRTTGVPTDPAETPDVATDLDAAAGDGTRVREFPVDLDDELDVFDDVVDPRLRKRWIDARRAEGRRRLYVLCGVVGAVAVLVIAWVVAHSSLLGAGPVEVEGAGRTPAAIVRAAAAIPDGEPLLFLDEGAVARRVEALPMVATAEVSTELPSTVVIRVTERQPIAWMRSATGPPVAVLDRDGRVLERVAAPPAGLTRVRGLGAVGDPGTRVEDPRALAALAALPDLLRVGAPRFDLRDEDLGPVLVLGGPDPAADEVRFGSLARVREKATAALAVLATLTVQGRHVAYVDVQVPDAPITPR